MKLSHLVILCLSLIFLSGCATSTDTASDIMARITSKELVLPDAHVYIDNADISTESYLSNEEFGYLYYGTDESPEELEAIESYCIRISKNTSINEIHIIKTKHKSDNDMIERMLDRRADILSASHINPNNSAFLCESAEECEVFSKGNFVFLVAGNDISDIINAIEESL